MARRGVRGGSKCTSDGGAVAGAPVAKAAEDTTACVGAADGAAGGASTTAAKPAKARPADGASTPGVFGRGGAAPRRSHQLERYSATGSGQAHERCPVDMAAGVCRQLVPPHRRHCRRVPDPVRGAAVPSCYAPPRQGGSMRHHEMSTHKRHPHNTQPTANGGVFLCATATSALVTLSLQGMMRGGRCAKDAMGRAGCRCQGSAAVQRRRRAHKAARARLGASGCRASRSMRSSPLSRCSSATSPPPRSRDRERERDRSRSMVWVLPEGF